ncbi:hypothetical protein [Nostoc sp. UCD121]|uniref:hypothetical protein n=1 Tax=Nostoc sp. UCD121 TaxID=2681305 RepID=UPI001628CB0E|nr:hypothetical protein [Nostoc sp. UCD121]MBC1224870.1 hypothetical protein [Nostoc sp. UCD120]
MQIYFTAWNPCIIRVAVVAGQLHFIKIYTGDSQNKATSAIALLEVLIFRCRGRSSAT